MSKKCILDVDKSCINCNECNICDLDPTKTCNNCMKCLETSNCDFKEVMIEGIISEDDYDDYIYEEEVLESDDDEFLKDSLYVDDIKNER